jgi:UDP-GlcNAc:undecaprenyl-phosphate GlcNAc-1-phosphate transferase
MTTIGVILAMSFILCAGVTPIVRRLAARCGLVDRPDGQRKLHSASIPVAGGMAVFLSMCVVLLVVRFVSNPFSQHLAEQTQFLVGLISAGLIICLVGLADDRWGWRARYKLAGQIVAVTVIMSAGLLVRTIRLFTWEIDLGWFAIPFTAFWLLGAINSLNLIDGMDGLLCSVGGIISLAMGVMAMMGEHWVAACVSFALAGALIGFLCFNFPPASVFLGDSGSMLIGLVIGVLGIHSSLKGPATIALAAPLATLAIPIIDTLAAIIRRKLSGRSVSSSDREHLHHRLLQLGFSSRVVLCFVSFACFATCTGALASLALHNEFFAVLSTLTVAGTLIATRMFGYDEVRMMKDHLVRRAAALLGKPDHKPDVASIALPDSSDWIVDTESRPMTIAGPRLDQDHIPNGTT